MNPHRSLYVRRLGLLWIGFSMACRAPLISMDEAVEIELPAEFSSAQDSKSEPDALPLGSKPWWTTFRSDSLDATVEATLEGNLELEQAWLRLTQAEATARISGAPRYPTINLVAGGSRIEIDQSGDPASAIPFRFGETYQIGPSLSYEVDLFGRIGALAEGARLGAAATEADAKAMALTISGLATDAWLTAVENKELAQLVEDQVATGEQLLEVTQARFNNGAGSALDVLQQKRLLEATRAETPLIRGEVERAEHQLATLRGMAPKSPTQALPGALPALPPLPALDVPSALLANRPDLIAAFLRVQQSDRDVATAIAARYPRLALTANFNFDANELREILDRTISTVIGNLTLPLVDGGSRRGEVARSRARLLESIHAFSQSFLLALQEVEDSLSLERRGLERIALFESQRTFAAQEVEQARRRYSGGIDSYLGVLAAVQNLQALDRLMIGERAAVLRARAQLLRALGGGWATELQRPESSQESSRRASDQRTP